MGMELGKLKEYIAVRLSGLTIIRVYNGMAPINAVFPYLTFKISSASQLVRNRSDKILEIDYWDDTNDDTAILLASNNIKEGLDYSWQDEVEGFYQCHLDFEGEIPDTESNISRINQRYILKVR